MIPARNCLRLRKMLSANKPVQKDNTANHHLTLSQHKNRMQQQRIAQNLHFFGYPPGLAHHMGAVDDKSG